MALQTKPIGALANQPVNKNFLNPVGFRFGINKLPNTNYFVQTANIPGVILGRVEQPSPFKALPITGDSLKHEDLEITFKVDENLRNWLELYAWMVGMGFPDNFGQYADLANKGKYSGIGIYSDATLMILDSQNNPIVEVTYQDIFPWRLSAIDFDARKTDVDYVEAQAIFRIQTHKIRILNTSVVVPNA